MRCHARALNGAPVGLIQIKMTEENGVSYSLARCARESLVVFCRAAIRLPSLGFLVVTPSIFFGVAGSIAS
jgi:hypothetical protein